MRRLHPTRFRILWPARAGLVLRTWWVPARNRLQAWCGSIIVGALTAAAAAPSAGNPLQVGIAPFAPFTMKNAQGRWEGISVELWENIARQQQVKRKRYPSEAAALAAVARGDVAACVAPVPMLKYVLARQMNDELRVLPFALDRMDYAFAVPDDSPLRETLNRALLRAVSQPVWPQTLFRYLGE